MYRNAIKETIFEASNYLSIDSSQALHLLYVPFVPRTCAIAVHKSAIEKIKYNWPIESKLWFCFSNIFKKLYLNNNKHNKTVTLNLFCWFCNLYARIVIQTVK